MLQRSALSRLATFICIAIATLSVSSLFAASVAKISDDAFAPLRAAVPAKRIVLDRLPLYDDKRSVIELEEFQVWAPDGKVAIHDGSKVKYVAPHPMRFFRGSVNGDPESFAYFSVDMKTGVVGGLVDTRDKRYAVSAARRPRRPGAPTIAPAAEQIDYFLTAADENDTLPQDKLTWECAVDKRKIAVLDRPIQATGKDGLPIKANGISGTQSYSITLEIQTDFEYYQNSGSNSLTAQTYATNLVGAMSTIYNRDLKTNVVLTLVNLWMTATDPWTTSDAGIGLDQLGDYYHNVFSAGGFPNTIGRTTSAVAMLSGKNIGSGIGWVGVACGSDFFQTDHWGGAYSWNGGIGNLGTFGFGGIPDPNATSNGTLYGTPSGTQNYWPLIQLSHELGHNMGSPHTHCMAISDAERGASIFTDGSPAAPSSNFVDHCLASEGGCFSGTNYVAGSQTTFKGTIMSYCHNVFSGGVPQSRFTFGMIGQPSQHVYDDYMLRALGPLPAGGSNNIVNGVGVFTISAVSGPAPVAPSSTGNSASITLIPGATYSWSIANGTITAGQGTSAITFTAGASGTTTVRVNAFNSTRCGVSDSKAIAIGGAAPPAPTNVVATAQTASSVLVSWSLSAGATSYNVYRYSGLGFTLAGNSTTSPFTDSTGLSGNKSYLYKVRATNGTESTDSNIDLATTVFFTDPTLIAGTTQVKAAHINELRTAVNAVRTLATSGAFSYTDPVITVGTTNVKAAHITDLRTALNAARATLALSALAYTDPTVTAGTTTVKIANINDLRGGVQ